MGTGKIDNTQIIESVLKSRKYKGLYLKTVERVVTECSQNYPSKKVEEVARRKLHQIWGAYWQSYPDYTKLLVKVTQQIQQGCLNRDVVLPLLQLQTSTQERISQLPEFYPKVFALTGIPKTVLDMACGFNPLTLPWIPCGNEIAYTAFDIDEFEVRFLNQVLNLLGYRNANVHAADVLMDTFPKADIVFMLKLLPPLEQQEKGVGERLILNTAADFVVVSFPTGTLSGKERGMDRFYTQWFSEILARNKLHYEVIEFIKEIVFVVKK